MMLFSKLKEIRYQLVLALVSLLCSALSGILFVLSQQKNESEPHVSECPKNITINSEKKNSIYADISGSVNKPGVYKLDGDSRLSDILTKSGGLNSLADSSFFFRNYNLARKLVDQEKIYVPSKKEIVEGIFTENSYLIDQNKFEINNNNEQEGEVSSGKISINTADKTALDTLAGIGEATAEKIISQRPFKNIDELVEKKILSQKALEKIITNISL